MSHKTKVIFLLCLIILSISSHACWDRERHKEVQQQLGVLEQHIMDIKNEAEEE